MCDKAKSLGAHQDADNPHDLEAHIFGCFPPSLFVEEHKPGFALQRQNDCLRFAVIKFEAKCIHEKPISHFLDTDLSGPRQLGGAGP